MRGSRIIFHGWSKDSRLVAYTRHRFDGQGDKPEQRMHRFVKNGQFAGFGRMVGGDVARYALDRAYVVSPLPLVRKGQTRFEGDLAGKRITLAFDIGEAHGWTLAVDDVQVSSHRFDRIYIGFDVELYVSPDARQALVVMQLETGWEVDAGVFAVGLNSN